MLWLLGIFCLIGISASVYVAWQKKSLVTGNEFKAVEWIRNNTPADSVFITQGGNGQMVNYFAGRKSYIPNSDYFLSDKLLDVNSLYLNYELEILNLDKTVAEYLRNFDYKNTEISELNKFIALKRGAYLSLLKNKEIQADLSNSPKYILYSFDKFNNLYTEREWWMKSNYFGAKLDKFNSLPLVYNVDGVKIWKLK